MFFDTASGEGDAVMPAVSAAVMCHPSRREAAGTVQARLAPLPSRVVTDPDPDGPPATIRTARLAYAAVGDQASHHLVVQDDVWVPDGFAGWLGDALATQPGAAASLFVEWGSRTAALVRLAALTGASWVPMINPYMPTQALALPAEVAREFARFLRTEATLAEADDEAALRFLRRAGVPTLVCVPNLVDHLELPSLTGNTAHGARRAACLALDQATIGPSVLELPERLPFLAWSTGTSVTVTIAGGEIVDRRPTLAVLAEGGCNPDRLAAAAREVVRAAGVGADHAFEVWVTAVATGVLLRQRWPEAAEALPARLADPLAARAWQTMAPGGLRLVVDVAPPVAEQLYQLARHGLRHGVTQLSGRLG